MNRKQQPPATQEQPAPLGPDALPLEAEIRAEDLEADAADEAPTDDDDEAEPGRGENAPGFLKRQKP